MTRLNIDILTLVIDNVDHPGTLFSLLTVSKQVFRYVCRALYRDPGYFLRKMDRGHLATGRFIRMALAFSPTADDMTKAMQQAFDVKQATTPPMFDYFSFIRVVRWDDIMSSCLEQAWTDYLKRQPQCSQIVDYNDLTDTLIMTISGHHLDKIIEIEIEIEPVAIERFISRASELSRLERIKVISHSYRTYTEHLYALVIKLVKAIHHHHGQGTLRECQIADVSLNTPSGKKFLLILELGSLLPPLPALKTLSIESPRPLDRYLTKLTGLSIFFTMQWLRLSEHYDCDLIRILQCCRELTHLEISKGLEPRHANLFAWAAQEERDRAAGKRMLPAVPLKTLVLFTGRMKEVDAMKIVRDALFAFARSLCQLEVNLVVERAYGDDDDDGDDDNWPSFAGLADGYSSPALPNLTELYFHARNPYLFDPRLLMGSRKLNWLTLRRPSHPHSNNRVHSWPLTSHPHLTYLYLEGVPTNAFDPRALANMPCLEKLTLKQALEDPTPERSLRMERWTWDWPLPELEQLHVLCAIEGWFSLKILRTCPRLQKLTLESTCKQMLEVGAVLDDSWPECERVVGNLTIGENWDITPTDLALLFNRVIPYIQYAELPKFDSCTQRQVVETTRDSRGLKDVKLLYGFLDSDEIKEVGLSTHPAFDFSRHDCRSVSIGGVKYYWRDSQSCPECSRMDKEEEEEEEEEEDEEEGNVDAGKIKSETTEQE